MYLCACKRERPPPTQSQASSLGLGGVLLLVTMLQHLHRHPDLSRGHVERMSQPFREISLVDVMLGAAHEEREHGHWPQPLARRERRQRRRRRMGGWMQGRRRRRA